ncbi:TIGR00725 family protein [Thermocrinis sp.]|uniref:TIGR00725 family protein n=1 Tax=Thermocrinis sp. TaxID=2024383 RepID=UPI002FDE5074
MFRIVSVIGSSQANEEEYQVAYQVGRFLAKKGLVVVCGGRGGVMEAVCKGAKEEGGLTVGIMTTYTGEEANPYVDIRINTGMNWNRNPIVVASGEFVIAIGGHWGTLSEIAYALILNKRIIGYKTYNIEGVEQTESLEELLNRIESMLANL